VEDALSTLILDVDDLVAVVAAVGLDQILDELIDELGTEIAAFDPARVEHQIRAGFSYNAPEHGLVEWMPTMVVGDVVSVKTVGYHPENPTERNIPSVLATTALYDTRTGSLSSISEATLLTALRTGAASAVMTNAMVRTGPISLGVVGCGAQAVTQIHAISRVREIASLVVTDTDRAIAESLAERLPLKNLQIEVVDSSTFDERAGQFDVICTCTSVPIGDGPVLSGANVRKDIHINAVGADFPGKTELGLDLLQRAVVIPDVVEQCLIEGECQLLKRSELGPSMVEVLSGDGPFLVDQLTVFDSTGWSFEDLLAARLFLGHARRLGLGTPVSLQRVPRDPYDPYEFVRGATAGQQSSESLSLFRDSG